MPHPIRTYAQKIALLLTIALNLCTSLPAAARAPILHDQSQPATPSTQPKGATTGFLSQPSDADALEIALTYLHDHRFELGLTEDDLKDIMVKDRYVSQHNGVTHLYLRQRLNGIEVFNGDININLTSDGRIINLGNGFVGDLRNRVAATAPTIDAVAAVQQVAPALGLTLAQPLIAARSALGTEQRMELSNGGISLDPIPVRLIYQPLSSGKVRLAWNMTLRLKNSADWLDLRADASTGAILSQVNWTADSQSAGQIHRLETAAQRPLTSAAAPNALPAPNSYLVYALPAENPLDGDRTLLTDPADLSASPYGWHDLDGIAGAETTTTQGNNTFTYADLAAPDGFGGGDVTVDAGVSLVFSHSINLNAAPSTYRDAALSNLFYVTNQVHDIAYRYGFDEAAGNFQQNNYDRGGLGNDSIKAEGQDYSGVNNANFSTPVDGQLPRMQMYLGTVANNFTISAPPAIAGHYDTNNDIFGPQTFDVTGDVVLVDDGSGTTSDGCQSPFVNAGALAGKIALIDRGTCSFKAKVKNAQDNGAIGVVLVNNVAGAAAPAMGNDAAVANPSIPVFAVTLEDGNLIKNQLAIPTAVTVTLGRSQRDGSLDNGVIIHEYGHGISNLRPCRPIRL